VKSAILVNAAPEVVVVVDVGADVVVSDCVVVVDVADSSGPSVVVVAPSPQAAATNATTARRSIARSLIRNLLKKRQATPAQPLQCLAFQTSDKCRKS
jgi:hypothetical protein